MYQRIEFDSCICPTCFSHFGKTGNSGLPLQKLREAIRSLSNISTSEQLMGCALYISPEFPTCNLRTYKDQVLIKDLSFEMKNYAKKIQSCIIMHGLVARYASFITQKKLVSEPASFSTLRTYILFIFSLQCHNLQKCLPNPRNRQIFRHIRIL